MRMFFGAGLVALAAGVLAAAAQAEDTPPGWLHPPTEAQLKAAWPVAALRQGLGGQAVLHCTVSPEGGLYDCQVVRETPPNMGFGYAALVMAPQFLMIPAKHNGQPVLSQVNIPVNFAGRGGHPGTSAPAAPIPELGTRIPAPPTTSASPGSIALHVHWIAAPSRSDLVSAYPAAARDGKAGGYVALSCTFGSVGRFSHCDVVAEQPGAKGFGRAALTLSRSFMAEVAKGGALDGVVTEVAFSFAPQTLDATAGSRTKIEWTQLPESLAMAQSFPAEAKAAHVTEGRARIACTAGDDGRLHDCALVSEAPEALGFGKAALSLASEFQASIWTDQGMPVIGTRIEVPIRYLDR